MTTRIAILGTGKMGQALADLARDNGCEVVAQLGRSATEKGITLAALRGAEVVIEFTLPSEAARLVRACAALGVPVVSGTTGWDAERAAVEAEVKKSKGALLWAPNFAVGVHLFARLVAEAARTFTAKAGGFEARIVETHHTRKLDAPSGTAKFLAAGAKAARGSEIEISSIREGDVVGTHELILDGTFEQVRLVHEARDRRVFAAGALAVARWLKGRQGVLTFDDFLEEIAR